LGALLPWAAICGAWLAQTWLEGSEPWTMAPAAAPTSLGTGLWRIVAVVLTYVVIYVQCLVEETAWRGYFLVRAMELLGPWKGLALHGIVWGLWYAPILMFVNGNLHAQPLRGAGFVVTCMLLGFVLGWLRLASRSIAPAVIANLILTLGAGLPIVLSGEDPGSQSAVFFPIGWIPLALIALVIGTTSARRAVVTPHLPLVARAQGDRLLH
ncbi:MAG TPA: CPBP family intramembrane glutamic endopeptidase, partial [Polyangiaceae bacterium]